MQSPIGWAAVLFASAAAALVAAAIITPYGRFPGQDLEDHLLDIARDLTGQLVLPILALAAVALVSLDARSGGTGRRQGRWATWIAVAAAATVVAASLYTLLFDPIGIIGLVDDESEYDFLVRLGSALTYAAAGVIAAGVVFWGVWGARALPTHEPDHSETA